MDIPGALSIFRETLDLKALKAVAEETIRRNSIRKYLFRYMEQMEKYPDSGDADVLLHEGDLTIDGDFFTWIRPFTGWLIVRGNLEIKGSIGDSLDPESSIIVTGDLRADNMVTRGWLEVHGDLRVRQNLIFLDNDCSTEIFGDVSAELVYTKYHYVKIHGSLTGAVISGDANRYKASNEYKFIAEDDVEILELLDRRIFVIEGDPDSDDEDGWCIDYLDSEMLEQLIWDGELILK